MAISLEELKAETNITWDDAETNKSLLSKAERAKKILARAAGRTLDFDKNLFARQLLFDCVRYLLSNAFAEFKNDYAEELLSLHIETEGEDNAETANGTV